MESFVSEARIARSMSARLRSYQLAFRSLDQEAGLAASEAKDLIGIASIGDVPTPFAEA